MRSPIVILAGGEGRRMGGPKPLRLLGGQTLLEHALTLARQWSDDVTVAVRDPAQIEGASVEWIADHAGIEGPLAGLVAALQRTRDARAASVLTLAVDMPFLPADLPLRLAGALTDVDAAIASSAGEIHPVCGLWRAKALEALSDYLASGRRSLRGYAEAVGFVPVDWPVDPVDPFFNINTAAQLDSAERMLQT